MSSLFEGGFGAEGFGACGADGFDGRFAFELPLFPPAFEFELLPLLPLFPPAFEPAFGRGLVTSGIEPETGPLATEPVVVVVEPPAVTRPFEEDDPFFPEDPPWDAAEELEPPVAPMVVFPLDVLPPVFLLPVTPVAGSALPFNVDTPGGSGTVVCVETSFW